MAKTQIARGHVHDAEGRPSSDPERFTRLRKGLARRFPGLIVQFSIGGRSGAGRERGGMLALRPGMASLTLGFDSFPTRLHDIAWAMFGKGGSREPGAACTERR